MNNPVCMCTWRVKKKIEVVWGFEFGWAAALTHSSPPIFNTKHWQPSIDGIRLAFCVTTTIAPTAGIGFPKGSKKAFENWFHTTANSKNFARMNGFLQFQQQSSAREQCWVCSITYALSIELGVFLLSLNSRVLIMLVNCVLILRMFTITARAFIPLHYYFPIP